MPLQLVRHDRYGIDYPGAVCANCGNTVSFDNDMSQSPLGGFTLNGDAERSTVFTCNRCKRTFYVTGNLQDVFQRLINDQRKRVRQETIQRVKTQLQAGIHPVWYVLAAIILLVAVLALGFTFDLINY